MAILSAVVALLVSRFAVRKVAEGVAIRHAGGIIIAAMSGAEGTHCRASPDTWRLVVPGVSETYAYDPTTLRPWNRHAPALDLPLFSTLSSERPEVVVQIGDTVRHGVLLSRFAGDGPCALVQTVWGPVSSSPFAPWLYGVMPLTVGLMSALISFVVAIRPLTRRIASLRWAAGSVGAEQGYENPGGSPVDDLGQLGRELDRAHVRIRADAEELKAERTALERHLADVAHDLRTPLASLQLALEHALSLNQDIELSESLSRALGDTVYAGGLVENLRLASKLEAGWDPKDVARVDLRTVIERVALRLKFLAEQRGIELEFALPDAPLVVSCQAVAIEQAISNVIENAVTMGRGGGHVAIVLEPEGDTRFVLTVRDDGPGVRTSELPRLGQRTFRSDVARQRAPRGSGLGLGIAAAVCERSGWELSFTPEQPQGLRVTFRGGTCDGSTLRV